MVYLKNINVKLDNNSKRGVADRQRIIIFLI